MRLSAIDIMLILLAITTITVTALLDTGTQSSLNETFSSVVVDTPEEGSVVTHPLPPLPQGGVP